MPQTNNLPPSFDREHGCTESEWRGWLPGAVRHHALDLTVPSQATISIDPGHLQLQWTVLPPRQIALARFPRLQVAYRFTDVDDAGRASFMRYFDLYMQRGGG